MRRSRVRIRSRRRARSSAARSRRTACARRSRCSRSRSASRSATRCSSSTRRRSTSSRRACSTLSGDADLEVRGPRGGFDEALYPQLARMPEVAVASPVVEVDAKLAGRDEALRIVGIDVFRAGFVQPGLIAPSADRLDTLRPDALFLSPGGGALARRRSRATRCTCRSRSPTCRCAWRASSRRRRDQRLAVMDIAGAQAAFDRLGRISRIDLRLRPGVDVAAFARAALQASLPPGVAGRPSRGERRGEREPVALVSRQPQRARAGRAVHRRPARVLDAGARGRAPARAVRAAARAGRDAPAARRR